MPKNLLIVFLVLLVLLLFVGCTNRNSEINGIPDKNTIHLRNIPTEVTFNGNRYSVIPEDVQDIENKIGTTSSNNFEVYKINNSDPEDSIAILVRENDPRMYYKADRIK